MSTSDPLIGKQLGDYKIEAMIGHGGMARVYRGYDATLDRNAAVKVIEPTLIASGEEEEYRDRFLREARAIARLNHPNIVGIYQFAQEENLYFISMAYLDGRDLRELLHEYAQKHELMPRDEMLKVLHDIANGLDYAHKNDIIHRDVKPSNIIYTNEGNAVLTDFGLALNAVEGTIGNTFGSVHYIAPEQAISSAQAVPQSDQYSLAVIVYEMLAGQVPFDDASAMSVALKHISDPPPPIRDLNSKVTLELEQVVMKALDKEPGNRYESVKAFINAFEQALSGAPDALVGATIGERPAQIPPVSPSMDDDAPTVDRPPTDSSISSAIPSATTQKMDTNGSTSGGMNMTIVVVAIVIVIALVIGGALAANSAAVAGAATETAIAEANATGTQDANIANTATVEFETTGTAIIVAQNATSTEDANIANTATAEFEATETANTNATSTAEFEATETANTNATSTAEFEATEIANTNATSTAEFEATETANANATSTAEFELSQTAQAEATDMASTATEVFVLTQDALPTATATLTPSATPTQTSSPTRTPSPTTTPSSTPSPTPIALIANAGEDPLLLRYDGRSILITNREPNTIINIDNLRFTKFVEDEDGNFVADTTFRMSSFIGAPSPLNYDRCLQIWNSRQYSQPPPINPLAEDICDTSPFWRVSNDVFWADTARDQYFEVSNGFDVLATCPAGRLGSPGELRCVIPLPD